jgi:hypothetical protein
MNLAVKFNLLKDTQPHYIYKPESTIDQKAGVYALISVRKTRALKNFFLTFLKFRIN